MKCPSCNSKMIRSDDSYHYTESGLDNVWLKGVDYFKCDCGETLVSISHMPKLHELLGCEIVIKKSLLTGKEIRFLRKNMGLTAKRLAQYLSVNKSTVSRWENKTQAISISNDRLIRLIYSTIKELPKENIKLLVEKNFMKIKPLQIASKLRIPWPTPEPNCLLPA